VEFIAVFPESCASMRSDGGDGLVLFQRVFVSASADSGLTDIAARPLV
jgi:hypothetical protein